MPVLQIPTHGVLIGVIPQTFVCFPNVISSSTFFEGYVGLSVPHVSAYIQRLVVFTRIFERSCCISSDSAQLSEAEPQNCPDEQTDHLTRKVSTRVKKVRGLLVGTTSSVEERAQQVPSMRSGIPDSD